VAGNVMTYYNKLKLVKKSYLEPLSKHYQGEESEVKK
jgi:hypothetical protein